MTSTTPQGPSPSILGSYVRFGEHLTPATSCQAYDELLTHFPNWLAMRPARGARSEALTLITAHVERLHRTIVKERWRPALARGRHRPASNLAHRLHAYTFDGDHHGRITQRRRPAELVYGPRKIEPR